MASPLIRERLTFDNSSLVFSDIKDESQKESKLSISDLAESRFKNKYYRKLEEKGT